jgi:uncharacterized protein (DUF433 family)
MPVHTLPRGAPSHDADTSIRSLLSLKEAIVLAGVDEKPVRKDIEGGILGENSIHRDADGRICTDWDTVFLIAAVYGNKNLSSNMRKTAVSRIEDMQGKSLEPNWWKYASDFRKYERVDNMEHRSIPIDKYVTLDLSAACHSAVPRVGLYAYGLTRIHEREDILGGEAVFENSRLPVTHVGKMIESGETVDNIIEDYPYLNEDDVRFSALYYRAHPATGRPRKGGDVDDVSPDSR